MLRFDPISSPHFFPPFLPPISSPIEFYELSMLDEAEAELKKLDPSVAAQSVPVLALRLMISYSKNDWDKMKVIARRLFLLDPSNPKWPFSDGFATAKIDSISEAEDQNRN
jgi:hypothetical protein